MTSGVAFPAHDEVPRTPRRLEQRCETIGAPYVLVSVVCAWRPGTLHSNVSSVTQRTFQSQMGVRGGASSRALFSSRHSPTLPTSDTVSASFLFANRLRCHLSKSRALSVDHNMLRMSFRRVFSSSFRGASFHSRRRKQIGFLPHQDLK